MSARPPADIGQRIRKFRKEKGLSGQRLCDLTGNVISRSTIADVELGRVQDITLTAALAIARAFGLSVEQLAGTEISPSAFAAAHEIVAAKRRLSAELEATA